MPMGEDINKLRAKISACGHIISRDNMCALLMGNIRSGDTIIKCPAITVGVKTCAVQWDLRTCKQVAGLTEEESIELDMKLNEIFLMQDKGFRKCPNCHAFVTNEGIAGNRVNCQNCRKMGASIDFCWECLLPWKGGSNCGNSICNPAIGFN